MELSLKVRFGLSFVGYGLVGMAVGGLVNANLGMDAFDVLTTGIAHSLHLPLGLAILAATAAFAWLALLLGQRPGWGTVAGAICVSTAVALSTPLEPHSSSLVLREVEYCVSVLCLAVGAAFVVTCDLGAGPPELVMLGLVRRGLALRWARTGLEITCAVAGYFLGGSFGVGTVVFSLVIGHLLAAFLKLLGFERREKPLLALQGDR